MDKEIFDKFRNFLFNRRSASQLKADDYWGLIKYGIPQKERLLFEIEWRHYILGEIDSNKFGEYFKEYIIDNIKFDEG